MRGRERRGDDSFSSLLAAVGLFAWLLEGVASLYFALLALYYRGENSIRNLLYTSDLLLGKAWLRDRSLGCLFHTLNSGMQWLIGGMAEWLISISAE